MLVMFYYICINKFEEPFPNSDHLTRRRSVLLVEIVTQLRQIPTGITTSYIHSFSPPHRHDCPPLSTSIFTIVFTTSPTVHRYTPASTALAIPPSGHRPAPSERAHISLRHRKPADRALPACNAATSGHLPTGNCIDPSVRRQKDAHRRPLWSALSFGGERRRSGDDERRDERRGAGAAQRTARQAARRGKSALMSA